MSSLVIAMLDLELHTKITYRVTLAPPPPGAQEVKAAARSPGGASRRPYSRRRRRRGSSSCSSRAAEASSSSEAMTRGRGRSRKATTVTGRGRGGASPALAPHGGKVRGRPRGSARGGSSGTARARRRIPSPSPTPLSRQPLFPQLDAEFIVFLGADSWENLHLPQAFAEFFDGTTKPSLVFLWEHNSTSRYDAEFWYDGHGHLYLGHGWRHFAKCYLLAEGYIMTCSYYAGNKELVVKIYSGKLTRRCYRSDDIDDNNDSDNDVELLGEVKAEVGSS